MALAILAPVVVNIFAFHALLAPGVGVASFVLELYLAWASPFDLKVSRWPNDTAIRPADLPPSSAVRGRFTRDAACPLPSYRVTNESSPTLEHEGALGYVSANAAIANAKVVFVRR